MRKLTIFLICIALVIGAACIALLMILTAPKAKKEPPPKMAPLVETLVLEAVDKTVVLDLTGTVVPAEEIQLQARVTGEIIAMADDFIEGGLLAKDVHILTIDPVDYELALADAQSALEQARFNYKLELGRKDVARREWELLKTDDATEQERELALRIPHLAASKAALEAAESQFKRARLNLSRTRIRAPFNAVVLERNINIGSQAAQQSPLARLAGTDACWIQVSIPVDRLSWITIPGSRVNVVSGSGAVREGTVIKLLGDLEEQGRMARLLVEVPDPLCLKPDNRDQKPLLLGEYVHADIEGEKLKDVYIIPRNALRENTAVWIADADGKLEIRKVDVVWRGKKEVIVANDLFDGEQLVVSDLSAPIHGMDVSDGNHRSGNATETETPTGE